MPAEWDPEPGAVLHSHGIGTDLCFQSAFPSSKHAGSICISQVLFYTGPKENEVILKAELLLLRTDLLLCCFLLHLLQGKSFLRVL